MPKFLGYTIADDATSVVGRSQSSTGFIESDIPLLEFMKVIDKKNGQQKINNSLSSTPQEIRDFLTWASGNKQPPLPPLARKILCLKRAIIKNSIASVSTTTQQRTGQTKQLEEIDSLLEKDGAQNLDNKELCLTQGSSFKSYPAPAIPASSTIPPPPPGGAASTGQSCQTHVTCDNSAMVALIKDIKSSLDRIQSMKPVNQAQSGAIPAIEGIKAQINGLGEQIERLSASGSIQDATSVSKSIGSVRSTTSDPASIAKSALEAAEQKDDEGAQELLNQLDDSIDVMKGFTDMQVNVVRQKLDALRDSNPEFGSQIDTIVHRIETQHGVPSKLDLETILKAIREIPANPSTNAATNAIERLKTNSNPAELHTELNRVKTLLNSSSDASHGPILEKIDALLAKADSSATSTTEGFTNIGTSIQELKDLIGPIPTIQTLLSDIKARVDDTTDHASLKDQLAAVRGAIDGLERPQEWNETVLEKINAIEAKLEKHRLDADIMGEALASIKLKLEDAISRIAGLPTNFDTIVADVITQVTPLISAAKDAVLEQLRLIKEDTQIIDMKVDALSRNTRNTKTGVDGLQEQLAQQSDMIREMRDEIQGLRTHVSSSCSMGPIADQIAGLRTNMEGLRALVDATKTHGETFDPIFSGIQTSLSDIAGQIASLRATNANGRNDVLIAEQERHRSQIEELQRELAHSRATAGNAQTELSAKQAELAEAQEALSRMRNESPRKNGLISELQERERAKNARIQETEGRIAEITRELEQLRASCDDELSQARIALDRLTAEAELLRSRIQQKDAEIANSSARISATETSMETLRTEKERLHEQIANLTARAANSDAAKAELESAQRKIRGLEISAMNADWKESAEREKREMEARLTDCELSKRSLESSIKSLTDRLASRNAQVASNATTIESLRSQLQQAIEDSNTRLADRNRAYRDELAELERGHATNIEHAAQSTVDEMEQELDALRKSCEEMDKKNKAEIKLLQEQLTKRGQNTNSQIAAQIADKDKQIAELTRRCEELKTGALAQSAEEFRIKEAELRAECLELKQEKDKEIARLITEHGESNIAKDTEIARLKALLADCEKGAEAARTAEVPAPITAPILPPVPPAPSVTAPEAAAAAPEAPKYKIADLAAGLRTAMMRDNRGSFDPNYMEHIRRLYTDFTSNDMPFTTVIKPDIERLYNLGWVDTIKREMNQNYDHLLTEKDYKLYLEKLFDIIMRYNVPPAPPSAYSAYTRRYGHPEKKSKRKTRKNRK